MPATQQIDRSFLAQKPSLEEVARGLSDLINLENGWRYGEGLKPQPSVVNQAFDILREGIHFNVRRSVAPTLDGGVEVSFYHDDYVLRVEVDADGSLSSRIEKGLGFEFEVVYEDPSIQVSDVHFLLSKIDEPLEWTWLESFIRKTMIQTRGDSGRWFSPDPQTVPVFRSSTSNAPKRFREGYVTI